MTAALLQARCRPQGDGRARLLAAAVHTLSCCVSAAVRSVSALAGACPLQAGVYPRLRGLWPERCRKSIVFSQTLPPLEDAAETSPHMVFPFLLFVVCGNFFAMNIFTGLLIDRFCQMRADLDGSAFLSEEQKQYMRANKLMKRLKLQKQPRWPFRKVNPVRYYSLKITYHPAFDITIMSCILLNCVTMMTRHFERKQQRDGDVYVDVYGQRDGFEEMQDAANFFFMLVFTVEAIIKLNALRSVYFRSSWNKFDLSLV
eukprot:gene58292-biopygen86855